MQISPRSVALLKEVAIPLEDTIDTVIQRLVNFYKEHTRDGEPPSWLESARAMPPGLIDFNPDAPPDLRHTRLIKAVLDVHEIRGTNWNEMVRTAVEFVYQLSNGDFARLRQRTTANVVLGQKTDEGYTPLKSGISVQGVAANDAFRIVREIAKREQVGLHVVFEWRDREGASYPGEAGQFVIKS